MDPRIADAIRSAAVDHKQTSDLARNLVRWFDAIASGSEDPYDEQSAYRHLEIAFTLVRHSVGSTEAAGRDTGIDAAVDLAGPSPQRRNAPTTLRVLGWTVAGLRCPDHTVDCRDRDGRTFPVSLVQMPNGTGKTTTLELLRAALSGTANLWSPARVRALRKRNGQQAAGRFELRLSLNDRPLTIVMDLDLDAGGVTYRTTWGAGQETGFRPPSELVRFMTEDFVHFFVFDGELAGRFLQGAHTDAERAVDSLFQVNVLAKMEERIQDYWAHRTRGAPSRDQAGHTRRTNLLRRWLQRRRILDERHAALTKDLDNTSADLRSAEKEYEKALSRDDARERALRDAKHAVTTLETQIAQAAAALLDAIRDPHRLSPHFADWLDQLKAGLDRAKLPESAAREFFEELAEEADCICGRPIDASIRPEILSRAQHYLAADDVGVLNAMKAGIADALGDSSGTATDPLVADVADLSRLVRDQKEARNVLHSLRESAADADADVRSASDVLTALRQRQDDLRDLLGRLNERDDSFDVTRLNNVDTERVESIPTVKEAIEELEKQVEETTETLGLGRTRDLLKSLLSAARQEAQRAIATEVRDETNQRIAALMPHNNIRVARIEGRLHLREQEGGSEGETLSVAYAFLSTLFDRAEHHSLPFVVDSPANPIDLDIRPKIGDLVPHLTGQFIAFVISSERQRFVRRLVASSTGPVQFATLFRKGISDHEERARQVAGCEESEDGLLVYDKDFFGTFQLDSEDK